MTTNRIYTLRSLILTLAFILGITAAGYSQSNSSSDELKQSINETYTQLTQLLKSGKVDEIARRFYTEDAKFFPPTGGVAEGPEAIGKAFGGLVQAGLVVVPEAQEVESSGDMAYEYGIGTLYNEDGKVVQKERYIVVWKKEGTQWKMYRDFVKGLPMK